MDQPVRCSWCLRSPEEIHYHDTEWGVPLYDSQRLFEFMVLDTFQAGLSWTTVLRKRENFRKAFDGFDARKIAVYNESRVQQLMNDPGIIRNQLKIRGAIINAQKYLELESIYGGFSAFVWQFTQGKPIMNYPRSMNDIPVSSPESDAMSKALKKRGFKFVGTTICYAFMQAAGMVNDHTADCFRKNL